MKTVPSNVSPETSVEDARKHPDAKVMHRMVRNDVGMMPVILLVTHDMAGHRKDIGKPLTEIGTQVDLL